MSSHTLSHWRRHAGHHRYAHVRYGRDPGFLSSTGGKVAMVAAALGLGGVAFFMSRKASAAQPDPSAPTPTTPPSPGATPQTPPAAPPAATTATIAQVTTHDPPTAGDLNVFDRPDGTRVGGAEKDSIVKVLSNDGTWAQIQTNNQGGRYADQTGFVHAKFLADPDISRVGQQLGTTALDTAKSIASSLGF
jgi:hypothetical protein